MQRVRGDHASGPVSQGAQRLRRGIDSSPLTTETPRAVGPALCRRPRAPVNRLARQVPIAFCRGVGSTADGTWANVETKRGLPGEASQGNGLAPDFAKTLPS